MERGAQEEDELTRKEEYAKSRTNACGRRRKELKLVGEVEREMVRWERQIQE